MERNLTKFPETTYHGLLELHTLFPCSQLNRDRTTLNKTTQVLPDIEPRERESCSLLAHRHPWCSVSHHVTQGLFCLSRCLMIHPCDGQVAFRLSHAPKHRITWAIYARSFMWNVAPDHWCPTPAHWWHVQYTKAANRDTDSMVHIPVAFPQ